jgi:hypothetical protein
VEVELVGLSPALELPKAWRVGAICNTGPGLGSGSTESKSVPG